MMTNHCYSYDFYNRYCVGGDAVKLSQQFYSRKRIIRSRLFHKGRIYWFCHDVQHEIHEIYRTMSWKIHRTMRRIVRFEYELVMAILRLNAPILAALTR